MSESLTIKKYKQQTKEVLHEQYIKIDESKKYINPVSYENQARAAIASIDAEAKQTLSEKGYKKYHDEAESLVNEYTKNYQKQLRSQNINISMPGTEDTDPVSQQVDVDPWGLPVYATFNNGKNVGHNVSGYAGTNNTFSMCDMVCTIDIVSNTGKRVVATLGKLQTLSYSIFQNKAPVRSIGNMNAIDYVYGQRTIAGSLIFAVFNQHWLVDIYNEVHDQEEMKNWHFIADEIPPFDITISFANEYGFDSRMAIYGVRLVNEGQTMSINDIYIENTYEYVATDIEIMDSLKGWYGSDKLGRRYKNTAAISSPKTGEKDSGTTAPPLKGEQDDNETTEEDNNSDKLSGINSIIVLDEDDLKNLTRREVHVKLQTAYSHQRLALEEEQAKAKESGDKEAYNTYANEIAKLTKQYRELSRKITEYYNKKEQEAAKK